MRSWHPRVRAETRVRSKELTGLLRDALDVAVLVTPVDRLGVDCDRNGFASRAKIVAPPPLFGARMIVPTVVLSAQYT